MSCILQCPRRAAAAAARFARHFPYFYPSCAARPRQQHTGVVVRLAFAQGVAHYRPEPESQRERERVRRCTACMYVCVCGCSRARARGREGGCSRGRRLLASSSSSYGRPFSCPRFGACWGCIGCRRLFKLDLATTYVCYYYSLLLTLSSVIASFLFFLIFNFFVDKVAVCVQG